MSGTYKTNYFFTSIGCWFVLCFALILIFPQLLSAKSTKDTLNVHARLGAYTTNDYMIDEAYNDLINHSLDTVSVADFYKLISIINQFVSRRDFKESDRWFEKSDAIKKLTPEQENWLTFLKAKQRYYQQQYLSGIELLLPIANHPANSNTLNNNIYYYLGVDYYRLKDYDKAIRYFNSAIPCYEPNVSCYFDMHLKIANCCYVQNKLPKALKFLQEGLEWTNNYNKGFSMNLISSHLLQYRAFVFRQMALKSSDSLSYLKKSVDDSEQSVVFMNQSVKNQNFESDQLQFNGSNNYFFYKTIEALWRLNQAQPNDSLLFKAFYYAELDKSLALLREFQKEQASVQTHVPDALSLRLDSLHYALNKTDDLLEQLNQGSKPMQHQIAGLYQQKEKLLLQIDAMNTTLEANYPEYAKIKNQLPQTDTSFLRKLSHQKQIVEYVISPEKVYVFLISEDQIHLTSFKNTALFKQQLSRFRDLTSNPVSISFSDTEFKEYQQLAYKLYQVLLEPLEPWLNSKPLLIIPDNELNFLPFEALVTEPYSDGKTTYAELDYVLNKHEIAYALSVEVLHRQTTNTRNNTNKQQILAYAPSYQDKDAGESAGWLAVRSVTDTYGDLPGAQNEVKELKRLLPTLDRTEQRATESLFKEESEHYGLIHCAMHSYINNKNPMLSKLVFTPQSDTLNDNLLNAYEISHLKIPASLVVLSACNSGNGPMNSGDGLLSLSRSFVKAGSKSILSTLWPVSDLSSAQLMVLFYQGLSQNYSKSVSLTRAKRQYLATHYGMDAHPYFWAGYLFSGNDSSLELKTYHPLWNYLLGLLALVLGFFGFRLFRK